MLFLKRKYGERIILRQNGVEIGCILASEMREGSVTLGLEGDGIDFIRAELVGTDKDVPRERGGETS